MSDGIEATQIPCVSRARLEELGYQTGRDIFLPSLGMEVALGDHFYRDDGSDFKNALGLSFRAFRSYLELDRTDQSIMESVAKLAAYNHGGYVLSVRVHVGKQVNAISKALAIRNVTVPEQDCVKIHEEAHVMCRLGKAAKLTQWFERNGFPHVSAELFYALGASEGAAEEYICSAVGLADAFSKGRRLEQVNTRNNSNVRIHEQIAPILLNGRV